MALSNVRWKGMKALVVMADILPSKIAGKRLSEAYKYALKPTKTGMLENVKRHERSKALFYSIDTTVGGTQEAQQMFAVVGPRRRKNTWNMSGWGAHLIESGTKPHKITAGPGKIMPVFTKAGFTGKFAKTINHPGSKAFKPFSRAMDITWRSVADRVSDKVAEIMRDEIRAINVQYGQVITSSGNVLNPRAI